MEELTTIQKIAVLALPAMFAIILHEVSHGWVAHRLGDPTAKAAGRLTLNPLSHIDIFGTIILPIALFMLTNGRVVFGYAKPVPIDPQYFRDQKKGMALSALAGPGVNIAMAAVFSVLLRGVLMQLDGKVPEPAWSWFATPLALMLSYGIVINVILAVVNMIPIPPLDGSRIMYWLLPPKQGAAYYRLQPYIIKVFLYMIIIDVAFSIFRIQSMYSPLQIVFSILGLAINPIVRALLSFFIGSGGF